MNYWLIKSEPSTYSWSDLCRDKKTVWEGVRNFQARNHLRAMQRGDLALFYHSGEEKAVVGVARIEKTAYPDPSAREGDWSVVDVAVEHGLTTPVTLAQIKTDPALKNMVLVKQSRLSVQPATKVEFDRIVKLGGGIVKLGGGKG